MAEQPSVREHPTPHVWSQPSIVIAATVLVVVVIGLVTWRMQTPPPLPADASPTRFSARRAVGILQQFLAEGQPRPAGSAANATLRGCIASRLQELGYVVEIEHSVSCTGISARMSQCAPVYNIVAHLPGEMVNKAVLLVTHYDSAAASPGASDDGAGVAALMEIARILKLDPPGLNPVMLLITDGEEDYDMGARAFMDNSPWSDKIGVVINLEARGTSGQSLMFETSPDNNWLIAAYSSVVPNPATSALMVEAYRATGSGTDLTIFIDAGIPGVNLAFTNGIARYHTPLDNLSNINPGSLQQQGDTALALARALVQLNLTHPPTGDAAYMDLLGLGVIHWPASWSLPLAILALLILLVTTILMIRNSELGILAVVLGFIAPLCVLVLAVGLGYIITWLVPAITHSSAPWTAYPLPIRIALWCGALLCTGMVSAMMGRRVGWWGFSLGLWLCWALLAVLLSLVMPGAAILFLLPVMVSALAIAVVVLSPLRQIPVARAIALLVPFVLAGIVWLPSALHFEATVGFAMSPVIMGMTGLVTITLLPCLALPKGQTTWRRSLIIITAAATLISTVIALLVPPYSAANPQPLNLYHFEDRDTGRAAWISIPFNDRTPLSLNTVFNSPAQAVFPWTSNQYFTIPSELTSLAAPDLQVLSDSLSCRQRSVTVRLESSRAPREFDLRIPLASLASLSVAGQTYTVTAPSQPPDPTDTWSQYYHFYCFGSECNGLEVTLNLTSPNPVEMLIADRTSGLPPGAECLLELRDPLAVPIHEGDETVILKRVKL
jgi:hypothetical protein